MYAVDITLVEEDEITIQEFVQLLDERQSRLIKRRYSDAYGTL